MASKIKPPRNIKAATKILRDGWWIELSIDPDTRWVVVRVKNVDDELVQQKTAPSIMTALRRLEPIPK